MACIYSLEARGLENYLGFTFFIFFSFIGTMAGINSSLEEEVVFKTNLLVNYQKKHCFPKFLKKEYFESL